MESSDSIELLKRLVYTKIDCIPEEHRELSFCEQPLPAGVQLKDYGDGSTLQLDAPLRGGKDVTDEDNQSALPDFYPTHFPGSPSQCAVEDHSAIIRRLSPSSLQEEDAVTSRIPVNGGDAAAKQGTPAEAAPGLGSVCAFGGKGGCTAPAAAVLIRRGKRGGLAFDEGAMDPQSRRRVVRNRESASASRRRKQVESSQLRDEVCRLRDHEANLEAELTHARARALLAEVLAHASEQQLRAVRGETMALKADQAALRDALFDARAELAVLPQGCRVRSACSAPAGPSWK